jgi:hypothetical protein
MAKYRANAKDVAYRYYMSDCLNLINQHKYLTKRYRDIIGEQYEPQIEKSGDEIAAEIIAKAGLIVK